MIPAHRLRAPLLWLAVLVAGGALAAEPGEPAEALSGLPPGLEIEWQHGSLVQTDDGGVSFTGPVTVTWRESRIQADRMTIRGWRQIEAEGNILVVWGQNRISGARLTYDLDTERGVVEDAMGYALDQYLITAEEIEKIGDRKLHLKHATVTTCSQPLPYWSFAISSATVTLEKYARMWNVRLRGLKAPLVYLPYLVWPVKEGRAAGVLMPDFTTTRERGDAITVPIFIPLGRSADVTLIGRNYSTAGLMGGAELRFIPNLHGSGMFNGYFIDDEVEGRARHRIDYRQTQEFRNGFRMVADVGLVSDPEYYTDFERDLEVVSSPQSLARLEFSRNGPWVSLNVREVRREQLSSGLIQSAYPEIELRARSHKLGPTPLYFAFESSVATIEQASSTLDADYLRTDVGPEITLPWSPVAWFDITPRVAYRWTYWTQHQETDGFHDDPLTRQLWSYGVDLVGPKFFRVFGRSDAGARYKHTIEPRLSYGFDEEWDRAEDALDYDEIDQIRGAGTRATYSLVQRLFARRPQGEPTPPPRAADRLILPDGSTYEAPAGPDEKPGDAPRPTIPVEIASLEVRQARSFDEDLSSADFDGDGVIDDSSPYSDISVVARVNPTKSVSVDARTGYHILFDQITDVSLSGNLHNSVSNLKFSAIRRNGLGANASDSMQGQLTGDLDLLQERLRLRVQGSYNAHPLEGEKHFPEQLWRLQYATQCCTFLVDRLSREFGSAETRRELNFRVDLQGVGKLLEKQF